jgi:hypothetical protein
MATRARGVERAVFLAVLLHAAGPALADVEISARVTILPGAGDEGGWVDIVVDGEQATALDRCRRLARGEIESAKRERHRAKLALRCAAKPLQVPGRQMLDDQILRVRVTLPSIDESAPDAPSTTGHVLRYTRLLSAAECERQRASLAAAQAKVGKGPLEREIRLSQEKISQICEKVIERPIQRKPSQNHKFLEADWGHSRCQQAKRIGEILAAKHDKANDEYGCVRLQ